MSFRRTATLLLLTCLTLAAGPRVAAQEYFGRNKVQYKKLDFQILKTEHFDIYFYPSEREGIDISARLAERWHARLQRLLSHTLKGRQPLILYASHSDFEQTNAIAGELGEGTGGVTESLRRRIVLPLGGPLGDTDHVIGHELVHAFQYDITTNPNASQGQTRAEGMPLWFIEGMAEYLSIGPVDPNTAMWMRDAAREEKLPTVGELDDPKYFPYRWGQALWAYIGGRWGDDAIKPMLTIAAASRGDMEQTFQKVLGVTTKEFSADWHAAIRRTYEPVLAATTPAGEVGRLVVKGEGIAGQINVGPTLSPDGRLLAFLSERGLFSIDLFVADASTGKVLRKLTSNATDAHYSSIQFIYSAGGWARDSKRIAIATVTGGRPALAIFNAETGEKELEIPVEGPDEIFNPTWAPDGHAICFTGMSRGLTDLYIYDLQASTLRQVTNDPYADLQPAWSPDGAHVAFATDRFTTHLDTLEVGEYRLALLDPSSGKVEQVRPFTSGKNINPQWSPDSRALFFISDRDGIPNLYRVGLAGGEVTQLTRVSTGLGGITSTSPALSVSASTGVAAFSIYQAGKHEIYAIDDVTKVSPIPLGPASMTAATLPPTDRKASDVAQFLANPTFGLPAAPPTEVASYKPSLSLEGVAQPSIAVGGSRYGAAIGGGIGLQFGDMLGDHVLTTVVQVDSGPTGSFSFKNTAAQLAYLNQSRRWNWGFTAGQLPYFSGGFQSGFARSPQGEPLQLDQTIIFRQTERTASAVTAYPFSRAHRVEFQGGVSQLSFDQIVQTSVFSLNTGLLLSNSTEETRLAQPMTLGTSSAALVFDTSSYGATSPVQGQRYRFEAAPTFGSINFTNVLADYRRYFMPASFYTFATRVMHYGRYGSGAGDERLFPVFIGYPTLVRGYDVGTFDSTDCPPNAAGSCAAFDRLIGSRVLVANAEFRFPLLRPFGVSQRMYGPLPVEVAFFVDGGVAWDRGQSPSFLGGARQGVGSAGVALRVNLFGYVVGQFDVARPFQRPRQGWVFQFSLSPGF